MVMVKQHDIDYEKAAATLKRLEEESEQSSSNTDAELSQRFNKQSHRDSDFLYNYDEETDGEENSYVPTPPKFPFEKCSRTLAKLKPLSQQINGYTPPDISQPTSNPPVIDKCQCEKNTKIMERLLRNLQIVKMDVKNLVQMANNEKYTDFQILDSQLSFKTYEEFQNFNNKLAEQDYFNKMQSSICLLGGRDLQDTTRKIVSLLVSHELVLKINWIGANEKGSFQKLETVLKLICGAVRRNPICANATNSEINQSISLTGKEGALIAKKK